MNFFILTLLIFDFVLTDFLIQKEQLNVPKSEETVSNNLEWLINNEIYPKHGNLFFKTNHDDFLEHDLKPTCDLIGM